MLYVIPATSRHTRWLARFLREADREEIRAATGSDDFVASLETSLAVSDEAYTIMLDRVPVGIFGVAPIPGHPDKLALWLLGTELMTCRQTEFLRGAHEFLDLVTMREAEYTNFTHENNIVHHRWLRWLGCRFHETVSINGHRFKRFTYVRSGNRHRGHESRAWGRIRGNQLRRAAAAGLGN